MSLQIEVCIIVGVGGGGGGGKIFSIQKPSIFPHIIYSFLISLYSSELREDCEELSP